MTGYKATTDEGITATEKATDSARRIEDSEALNERLPNVRRSNVRRNFAEETGNRSHPGENMGQQVP